MVTEGFEVFKSPYQSSKLMSFCGIFQKAIRLWLGKLRPYKRMICNL